jgi:Ser/Thr protein kinase RdoA (MazF antagonist)
MKLDREHPTIASDKSLAFPIKILHVDSLADGRDKDLIVMKMAPGEALAMLMARLKRTGQEAALMRIFEKVGEVVAEFHKRYGGKQHGDLHGSNIFYDEASRHVTLIDLRDMGTKRCMNDVEYFTYSLRLVTETYPRVNEYIRHFQLGYARGMGKRLEAFERRFEPLQRLRLAISEVSGLIADNVQNDSEGEEEDNTEEEDDWDVDEEGEYPEGVFSPEILRDEEDVRDEDDEEEHQSKLQKIISGFWPGLCWTQTSGRAAWLGREALPEVINTLENA